MGKRIKVKDYPGIYYRDIPRQGHKGLDRAYVIVFKREGKVYEEKVGTTFKDGMTPAKAARIRALRIEGKIKSRKEKREEAKAKKKAEAERITINRLWQLYRPRKPQSPGSRATDVSRYQKFIEPTLGDKEPEKLVPLDVERMTRTLLKKKSPQTVKHVVILLKRILNYGVDKGLIKPLPFKIKAPSVDNIVIESLTGEQLQSLLKAIEEDAHPHAGPIMLMALYTGMRRGEILKLQWDAVDFDRGFITIKHPKGGKTVTIPMNAPARKVLEGLPRTHKLVFPGPGGKPYDQVYRILKPIREKANLPKGFRPLHGLRHVYASMLASSGKVDMFTLQRLLTHKSPQMTQRYAHLHDSALRRASNLMGKLVNGEQ